MSQVCLTALQCIHMHVAGRTGIGVCTERKNLCFHCKFAKMFQLQNKFINSFLYLF